MRTRAALVVLQARMGSTRLPGKVRAVIEDWPLVEYCVARLVAADVGPVVIATTTDPADAVLLEEGRRLGVETSAGPVQDVLRRYADVVRAHPAARYVLRATADNPFVDIDASVRVLKALEGGADYAVEEGLPLGAAVEGVRRDVLLQADRDATTAYDREHVTPWVKRAAGIVQARPAAPAEVRAPDLRLTVDTPDDLSHARAIAARLRAGGRDPRLAPLPEVIAVARTRPSREVA